MHSFQGLKKYNFHLLVLRRTKVSLKVMFEGKGFYGHPKRGKNGTVLQKKKNRFHLYP